MKQKKIEGIVEYELTLCKEFLVIHLNDSDLNIHIPSYKRRAKK